MRHAKPDNFYIGYRLFLPYQATTYRVAKTEDKPMVVSGVCLYSNIFDYKGLYHVISGSGRIELVILARVREAQRHHVGQRLFPKDFSEPTTGVSPR